MRPLSIHDPGVVLELQDEIGRSQESRYDHRLHCVLLVAQRLTCAEVARLLGDSTRAVQSWVRRFEEDGMAGLVEGERPGHLHALDAAALKDIGRALRQSPEEVGLRGAAWDSNSLSAFIKRQYGLSLGVRQCQRLLRTLGFQLRKPGPFVAAAGPKLQRAVKHK